MNEVQNGNKIKLWLGNVGLGLAALVTLGGIAGSVYQFVTLEREKNGSATDYTKIIEASSTRLESTIDQNTQELKDAIHDIEEGFSRLDDRVRAVEIATARLEGTHAP